MSHEFSYGKQCVSDVVTRNIYPTKHREIGKEKIGENL